MGLALAVAAPGCADESAAQVADGEPVGRLVGGGAVPEPHGPAKRLFSPGHGADALSIEGGAIALRRDALGQLFVLRPQLVEANNTPRVLLGSVKLVTFSQHGDTLAMMEPGLHAVYNTLPSDRLLQTFTILRQDATHLVFAWPADSGSLYLREPAAPSDLPLLVRQYISADESVLPIIDGVIQDLHVTDGTLHVHHIARTRGPAAMDPLAALFGGKPDGGTVDSTFYSALQLEPFVDNPAYGPKIQSAAAPPHYLQVPRGQLHASEVDFYAMAWDSHDEASPIIYDIASDVPDALVQAISDGVLYWNRAAGRTLTAVRTGAATELTPSGRHVPIRWIPWHRPGAASIAEVQPNPVTGEIIAAEIYLTSAFYEPSFQLLAQATELSYQARNGAATCMAPRSMAPSLLDALGDDDGRNFVARAMVDNIRHVVAHEVGHTLGLRHNFAASLESQVATPKERQALWAAYTAGHTQGAAVASSVMDYLPDVDSFLVGAHIRHDVLPYDAWAIQMGYGGPDGTAPWDGDAQSPWLFCSDGERLSGILGCRQFDSSPNPFAGALSDAQQTLHNLPLQLMLTLAERKHGELDELTVKHTMAKLRPEQFSLTVALITQELFNGLRPGVRVLPVERQMGYLRHTEPLLYSQAGLKARRDWLAAVGGLPGLLQQLLGAPGAWDGNNVDDALGWMAGRLRHAVAQAAQSGRGHFGTAPLQPSEQDLLLRYGPLWAEAIEQAVLTDVLLTLTGEGPRVGKQVLASLLDPLGRADNSRGGLDAALVDPAWQKPLCAWAQQLVLASDDFISAENAAGPWRVAKPKLNVEARLAALRLMAPEVFHIGNWGHRAREALLQELLQRLFTLVDQDLLAQMSNGSAVLRMVGTSGLEELLQLHTVPEPIRIWALDEMRIIQVLMALNATKRLPPEAVSSAQLF